MTEGSSISVADGAKVLSHPLRIQILETLNGDGEARSPRWLAKELGQKVGDVAYHVKVLREVGAIKLTGTRSVRGAIEHFYMAQWRVRLVVEPAE